jgi:hypothetical protein
MIARLEAALRDWWAALCTPSFASDLISIAVAVFGVIVLVHIFESVMTFPSFIARPGAVVLGFGSLLLRPVSAMVGACGRIGWALTVIAVAFVIPTGMAAALGYWLFGLPVWGGGLCGLTLAVAVVFVVAVSRPVGHAMTGETPPVGARS